MESSGVRFMRGHRRETRMFADLALIYNADLFLESVGSIPCAGTKWCTRPLAFVKERKVGKSQS